MDSEMRQTRHTQEIRISMPETAVFYVVNVTGFFKKSVDSLVNMGSRENYQQTRHNPSHVTRYGEGVFS